MGLFDKIKDNAKTISLKALDEAEQQHAAKASAKSDPAEKPDHKPAPKHEPVKAPERKLSAHTATEQSVDQPEPKQNDDDSHKINVEKRLPTISSLDDQKPKTDAPRKLSESDDDDAPLVVRRAEPKPEQKPEPKPEPARQPRTARPAPAEDDDEDEDEEPDFRMVPTNRRNDTTLAAMAAHLQMTGSEPIYSTTHMNFRTRVYINRIEYTGSFGKIVRPVARVGWIKIRVAGTGIIIETTNGKRVVMIVDPKHRVKLSEAIMKVQEAYLERGKNDGVKGTRAAELERLSSGIEELEKLAKLKDKGIISDKDFEAKKKQLLGL
jgi:hypothetical protein